MKFIKIPLESALTDLGNQLLSHLSNQEKVLWLVSGGSNIGNTIAIMNVIPDQYKSNLELLLVDERYGPADFERSNYNQLIKNGLKLGQARFETILRNISIEASGALLANRFEVALRQSDFTIAQIGIGKDGHIAGILPSSPAINSKDLVATYQAADFDRITLTFKALQQIDHIAVFCYGPDKREALDKIYSNNSSVNTIPGLFLQQIKRVRVYNDQIGEAI